MIRDFRDLEIWKDAHRLTITIYKLTSSFPRSELYGLTSQMRRTAVSVELNIAESHGRYHYAEEVKFLLNARGSISEIQAGLLIASDLKFTKKDSVSEIYLDYHVLTKRINSLIKYKRDKNDKK